MKKFFRKIIDYLFYQLLIEIIEDEFTILLFLKVDDEVIKETRMKYLPRKGDFIEYSINGNKNSIIFEVEKIIIMQFGSVAYLNGKII